MDAIYLGYDPHIFPSNFHIILITTRKEARRLEYGVFATLYCILGVSENKVRCSSQLRQRSIFEQFSSS